MTNDEDKMPFYALANSNEMLHAYVHNYHLFYFIKIWIELKPLKNLDTFAGK